MYAQLSIRVLITRQNRGLPRASGYVLFHFRQRNMRVSAVHRCAFELCLAYADDLELNCVACTVHFNGIATFNTNILL